jgi:oxygen-independent coproporphyrinogen-3 oxidase
MARYVWACGAEWATARREVDVPLATSIFVGGGTPSRVPAELLGSLLGSIDRTDDAEITVECNPEDASPARFEAWRAFGVNRLSFGVQSMARHVLQGLGRRHDPAAVSHAVRCASRAGFESVNVDLIYGGAGESSDDWRATLEAVLGLDPPPQHVSTYALTVEPGTPLAADPARHPDEDAQADRYELADQLLSASGYRWYELSNWARPGHECRHNRLYWTQGDYRGIGCAAHSHERGRRWWNVRTPERYIAAIDAGHSPCAGEEVLSPEQRGFEELALSLRTVQGVPHDALPRSPDLAGLVERRADRAVLTLRGRLLANVVTSRLLVGSDSSAMESRSVVIGREASQPVALRGVIANL